MISAYQSQDRQLVFANFLSQLPCRMSWREQASMESKILECRGCGLISEYAITTNHYTSRIILLLPQTGGGATQGVMYYGVMLAAHSMTLFGDQKISRHYQAFMLYNVYVQDSDWKCVCVTDSKGWTMTVVLHNVSSVVVSDDISNHFFCNPNPLL